MESRNVDLPELKRQFLNSILTAVNHYLDKEWKKIEKPQKTTFEELAVSSKEMKKKSSTSQPSFPPIAQLINSIYDFNKNDKIVAAASAVKHKSLPLFEAANNNNRSDSFNDVMSNFLNLLSKNSTEFPDLINLIRQELKEFTKKNKEPIEHFPELTTFIRKVNATLDKIEFKNAFPADEIKLSTFHSAQFAKDSPAVPLYLIITSKKPLVSPGDLTLVWQEFLNLLMDSLNKNQFPINAHFVSDPNKIRETLDNYFSTSSSSFATKILHVSASPEKIQRVIDNKDSKGLRKILESATKIERDYRISSSSNESDPKSLAIKFDNPMFIQDKGPRHRHNP